MSLHTHPQPHLQLGAHVPLAGAPALSVPPRPTGGPPFPSSGGAGAPALPSSHGYASAGSLPTYAAAAPATPALSAGSTPGTPASVGAGASTGGTSGGSGGGAVGGPASESQGCPIPSAIYQYSCELFSVPEMPGDPSILGVSPPPPLPVSPPPPPPSTLAASDLATSGTSPSTPSTHTSASPPASASSAGDLSPHGSSSADTAVGSVDAPPRGGAMSPPPPPPPQPQATVAGAAAPRTVPVCVYRERTACPPLSRLLAPRASLVLIALWEKGEGGNTRRRVANEMSSSHAMCVRYVRSWPAQTAAVRPVPPPPPPPSVMGPLPAPAPPYTRKALGAGAGAGLVGTDLGPAAAAKWDDGRRTAMGDVRSAVGQ